MRTFLLLFLLLTLSGIASAKDTLRIAVASNFHHTLESLTQTYRETRPNSPRFVLIPGSTGKLYAQILKGAPFDAFFSADSKRPELLEKQLSLETIHRFSYAHGVLALWSPKSRGSNVAETLSSSSRFSMANPELAPYGLATSQALERLGLENTGSQRIVGSNIAQAFSFVKTGAVDCGFVALSQLQQLKVPQEQYHVLDRSLYYPIDQQAISLSDATELLDFLEFCQSDSAKKLITSAGYRLPQES